jgi:hypothetical protein
MESGSANDAATGVKSSLKGYVPFPVELRTKDHLQPSSDAARSPMHTAVLILHGIGAQKPYETLDQFSRGLLGFFRSTPPVQNPPIQTNECSDAPTQQIRLRQYKANLNT